MTILEAQANEDQAAPRRDNDPQAATGRAKRGLVTIALLLTGAKALAAPGGDITTAWRIGQTSIENSERTATTGDILWKQPLEASGLVTLGAPAVAMAGKVVLVANTEMMAMSAGDDVIYCQSTPRKASFLEKSLIGTIGETAGCLIDADRDGRFDGYFTKKVQYEGFPVIRGGFPDRPKPLQPLAFEVRGRGASEGGYWMGIRYLYGNRASKVQQFQVVFGGRNDQGVISDIIHRPKGELPQRVEYIGGAFTIIGFEGKSMRYRVETQFPDQLFSVTRVYTITAY